ncbi:hypothetical protein Tco_0872589 [Tanacetum coccineum]
MLVLFPHHRINSFHLHSLLEILNQQFKQDVSSKSFGAHDFYKFTVDDIIFGSIKKSWCDEIEALMKSRFQISSMGELTFFLGLQVKQKEDVSPIETKMPLVEERGRAILMWIVHLYSIHDRDAYEKKLIQVLKIHTDDNVADLLTKAFDVSRKDEGNAAEFHEVMIFLSDSYILMSHVYFVGPSKEVTDQAKEIKHLKAQIKKLKKKAKPVITHHRAWMKSVSLKQRLAGKKSLKKNWMQKESVSKQGRKSAKAEPSVHKDPLFDELDDDEIDNMETEDAQGMGRTRYVVHEEKERKEKEVSTEDALGTDKQKDSTDKEKVSTDRPNEGTERSRVSTNKEKDSTD